MSSEKNYLRTNLLVVGAGPSGLACAIAAKKGAPELEVCVIDKGAELGNHNLSGAVLEPAAVHILFDLAMPNWRGDEGAKELLGRKVEQDDVLFLPGENTAVKLNPIIKLCSALGLGPGEMRHEGDYIVSISKLTKWMGQQARSLGIEVHPGFAAAEVVLNGTKALGLKLVDQGLDKELRPQPNYAPGEVIEADAIVLAEGCDGLVTERFVRQAGLKRRATQLYSIGIKEVIKVSDEQYSRFGDNHVVHALGYPVWSPLRGPSIFGGGLMYSYGNASIAVGMIVGLDWAEYDFNPQHALTHFKNHSFVRQYIADGKVTEAGAKMIPEGGLLALPRDPQTNAVGKGNVMILGDAAGLVNMLKIKGLHNALESGRLAGEAAAETRRDPAAAAALYTEKLEKSPVMAEMKQARNYRQTIAKFGNFAGMPLSVFSSVLPPFEVECDAHAMRSKKYRFRGNKEFDKDTFTALAHTEHREEQPNHLRIKDPQLCAGRCAAQFKLPCITFCPAGVYEEIQGSLKAANPSNCLHCKTCQRKCPLENIEWTVPEGGGGPRYKTM